MVGSIAMAHTTVPETYGAIMSASMAPYLGTDFETLKHAYRKDGYLYSAVEEALNGVGVHSFGFFCEGFNGIGTKVAVNQPAAIGVDKGVVVRVPAMDVHALGPLVLGYRTSTLSYSDTYTAIQTGVVDGWHSRSPESELPVLPRCGELFLLLHDEPGSHADLYQQGYLRVSAA